MKSRPLSQLLPRRLKRGVQQLLKSYGYGRSVGDRTTSTVDFRGLPVEPAEAVQRGNGFSVLVDVPLEYCRSFGPVAFGCTRDSSNPYVQTAIQLMDRRVSSYNGSLLELYYSVFQPINIAEVAGLDASVDQPVLNASPLWFEFPWRGTTGPAMEAKRIAIAQREARQCGFEVSGSRDWCFIGPVTAEKGHLEYARLGKLVSSIGTDGYSVEKQADTPNHIQGQLMKSTDKFAVMILSGHHRVAVMSALGYSSVPIRVQAKVTRREQASTWRGVKNGSFTLEQSLAMFDRVVDGTQPAKCVLVWPPS